MVSEKAFQTEVADVHQSEVAPEHVGEEGETAGVVQESAGVAAASAEGEDENVDLEAVLGGNIRKAPMAATEDEAEPEPAHATGA